MSLSDQQMPPPLPDDDLALLRSCHPGGHLHLPEASCERLFFRVTGTLAAVSAATAIGTASGASAAATSVAVGASANAAQALPSGEASAAASAASASSGVLVALKAPITVAVMSFALGSGTGAVVTRAVVAPSHSPSASSVVSPPVAVPPVLASVVNSGVVVVLDAEPSAEQIPSAPALSALAPSKTQDVRDMDRQLADERALLDMARSALARQDATDALRALERHAKRYPSGRMREERDALMVEALAAAGRVDEASRKSEKFRKDFPESLQQPVVEGVGGDAGRR